MNDKAKLAMKAIDDMKANESLGQDDYCKCMIELAYSFFKEDDLDSCLQSIGKCPPEYFKEGQYKQMLEDEVYKDTVIYLAFKLVQMGIVDVGYDIATNQARIGYA